MGRPPNCDCHCPDESSSSSEKSSSDDSSSSEEPVEIIEENVCDCSEVPRCLEVVVGGVGNDRCDNAEPCDYYNAAWILEFDETFSWWETADTVPQDASMVCRSGIDDCTGDPAVVARLSCSEFDEVFELIFFSCDGEELANYELAESEWDCTGTNTMTLVRRPIPDCTWPNELTLEPIGCP